MTQLTDDCFAFGGDLMTVGEALTRLKERIETVAGTETLPLKDVDGRVLAADVIAVNGSPPRDNAAVDGYALAGGDLAADGETRLTVSGRAAAGQPIEGGHRPGGAVRIFTGAVLPDGCDTVVMQEDVRVEGDTIIIPSGLRKGTNRRKANEDFASGATILQQGHRLRPQDIGLAAAAGCARLSVHQPLRVALFSTGDELREPGQTLEPGAINDANRYMLRGLIARLPCGVTDLGILEDRPEAVRDALALAAADHDLIITSGGVSTGEEDHVRGAVEALGSIHAWRLAVKPGRPIALGQVNRVPFVGLPGNPVAAMACFLHFARPLILGLGGADVEPPRTFRVRAAFEQTSKAGRREWVRAQLSTESDGSVAAHKFRSQGSGVISSLVESNGLVVLAEELTHVKQGDMVDFLPFSEVIG
jgi:molybdopterin molybdotransferase